MPDPPDANLFARYVLENPYPLAGVLLVAAIAAAWVGLRDGRTRLLQLAGAGVVLAAIVLATGLIVVTPAEYGRRITLQMVERVVQHDIDGAMALFAPDATFAIGSPTNPGMDVAFIRRQFDRLEGSLRVTSNRISSLSAYTDSSAPAPGGRGAGRAVIHLHCRTQVAGWTGTTPTQWVVWVDQQPDGEWRISRLTMVSIRGQTPSGQLW